MVFREIDRDKFEEIVDNEYENMSQLWKKIYSGSEKFGGDFRRIRNLFTIYEVDSYTSIYLVECADGDLIIAFDDEMGLYYTRVSRDKVFDTLLSLARDMKLSGLETYELLDNAYYVVEIYPRRKQREMNRETVS